MAFKANKEKKKYFAGQSTEQAQARRFATENRERMQEQDYLARGFRKLWGRGVVCCSNMLKAAEKSPVEFVVRTDSSHLGA